MAEIKPLKAWRYNNELAKNMDELTSPLFDVVSQKQRDILYKNPLNSIHLSVPLGDTPALTAKHLLANWKSEGTILQDKLPGIYVYYQYFNLPGNPNTFCRKGFICHIRAYDWEENVILRHENTIPKSVNDRIELLAQTELNVSPTHGLYSDLDFELEKYMDEAITHPLYESEDYQGVRDVLAVIHDQAVIRKFIEKIKPQQIILADGHHRYEGSMEFKRTQQKNNPNHTGNEGYNFHLMYLTNMEADDLRILPTHRLLVNLPPLPDNWMEKVAEYFIIKPLDDWYSVPEVISGKPWAFGLILPKEAYKIRLKPECLDLMEWKFPKEVKELDLTVLHYFFIEKVIGIEGKNQRKSEHIQFERNFSACLEQIHDGKAQIGLITNDISMEQVKKVCLTGYTMPQKSTYFYPKAICGFLFSSIKEDEFQVPDYSGF
ncbi:DUF1015 domain-containing protein [Cytophagales bacterium LB-30]|uniref:DUF1015 domain-containing protein n=1 Tax=Shiella aurantiaca TaxID=3058365 RepID=A0ABT8F1M4_9BACT|nr:DUF1015 domain-containing protein [Shiella aurantiaca]MDN4164352.1 DUF1015 domain-containing protein [Shiella aurantiaca]